MEKKIALCHDSFFIKGGADRMNIYIAKLLGADMVTSVVRKESFNLREMGFTGKIIEIHPDFKRGMLGFFKMKLAFSFNTGFLKGYDTVIFSNEAINAVRNVKWKKIYYAHSISRHLFDQKEDYLKKVSPYIRPLVRIALWLLKISYVSDSKRMDLILTNSGKNKAFLQGLAPKVKVEILYPPVDIAEFAPSDGNDDGYFLSYARLTHAKRIDRIIEAFKGLPDQKLRVIYGKNDPQKDEFMALWAWYSNISFETLEDNSVLPEIVSKARGVICVSKAEDFGMIPIESFASGVPVIAVAEGGYLETMIDGKTGMLLAADFTNEDLRNAIRGFTPEYRASLRESLIERAKEFSLESFEKRLKELM